MVILPPGFAFEFVRIAADKIEVQANELITNRQDDAITELQSQVVQGVAERLSPARFVVLRPEQRNQRVPCVQASRSRECEIAEQPEQSRLAYA